MSKRLFALFPLTAMAAAVCLAVTGCGGDDDDDNQTAYAPASKTIEFAEVPVPMTDEEKRSILASEKATVNGKDYPIGYNIIMRSGDNPDPARSEAFGQLFDIKGNPIYLADGSPLISNDNDFSSLLTGADGKLYMVSHFENYDAGHMYVTELDQDKETGKLSPVRTRHLDFSHFNGGWIHCAGSVTPWGTHLGSEEYEPDFAFVDPATNKYTGWQAEGASVEAAYFAGTSYFQNPDAFDWKQINWYDYGYQIEVKVTNFDEVEAVKHYSMGRIAHELGYVLPDRKTVYLSDDGSYVGLFRYVADNAGDLSAGTLYAAKWQQTGTENGGKANLSWIDLGHATDAEIRAAIDKRVTLYDLYNVQAAASDGSCPAGYTYTYTTSADDQGIPGECLQLRTSNDKGMSAAEIERAASRLETRRYAAYKGATTEWEKMEGITYDPDTNTLYQAMSRVINGMADDKGDMKLPYNYCGTVYAMPLDENYVAHSVHGEVAGVPVLIKRGAAEDKPYAPPLEKNECSIEHIAEPDNITFMPGYKTLIIGEDTGAGHQNDMIWAYNLETKKLTRIQTTPYGSETTSPYFYPNINGFAYLMSVVQHPFGESDTDKLIDENEKRAYTGYIGPFPAMD